MMLLCYSYVVLVILISSKIDRFLHISAKVSRKFLHVMIGNLPFVIPFFTSDSFPVLVAAPFVLVTLMVSPYSPFPSIGRRLVGLTGITEEGHRLGLVFYAISYTALALVFASKPYVIAAGILPMAYGDSAASIVGERYGRRRYRVFSNKSLEGSAAMFLVSFLSLSTGLILFSTLYSFSVSSKILAVLATTIVATLAEFYSPSGSDNLSVPVLSALTFLALSGDV